MPLWIVAPARVVFKVVAVSFKFGPAINNSFGSAQPTPAVVCFFGLSFRPFAKVTQPIFLSKCLFVFKFLSVLLFAGFTVRLFPSLECQKFSICIFLIYYVIQLCCIFLLFTIIKIEFNHFKPFILILFSKCNNLSNLLNHHKSLIFLLIFIIDSE